MFRFLYTTALAVSALAAVPTVTLRNGVEMPLVACGSGGDSDAKAKTGVALALAAGYTGIDTAHDYGCLKGVGEALADYGLDKRADYFLTTKVPGCGVPTQGLQPPCFDNTVKMATADIATLTGATGYVDLLLLHFPPLTGCSSSGDCAKIQQQWAGLEQLYAANLTRAIGVSNYCQTCIECVLKNATVLPMVNQIQYHVGQGADPSGLLTYCKQHGIVVEAYSPLAGGKLLPWAAGDALASKYGFNSSAQVAFSWIAQRGLPFVTKSDNAEYLAEDLDLFGPAQHISDDDRVAIDATTAPSCSIEAPGGCCHAK